MEFKVGQRVTITNTNQQYPTYKSWVRTNANQWLKQWNDRDKSIDTSLTYTVIAKGKHDWNGHMIYLVQHGDNVYLIGEKGIKEAEETVTQLKDFKVGDEVLIGNCTQGTAEFNGKTGEYLGIAEYALGRYKHKVCFNGTGKSCGWLFADSELTLVEDKPKFTVGSKVIVADGSYSMEFVDGKATRKYENICREHYTSNEFHVYEVTAVDLVLPSDGAPFFDNAEVNDTIIRRISDGRVFFVRQRFLKEYIPEPKFKHSAFVECGSIYARVVSSEYIDNRYKYWLTSNPSNYNNGATVFFVYEDELQEAK